MELEIGKALVIFAAAILGILLLGIILRRIPFRAAIAVIGILSLLLGFVWLARNLWGVSVEIPDIDAMIGLIKNIGG